MGAFSSRVERPVNPFSPGKRSRWVCNTKTRTVTDKAVLFVLSDYANDKNLICYPGIATIVRESGASRSSVLRSLKRLQEDGLIQVTKEHRKVNHYGLLMPGSEPTETPAKTVDKSLRIVRSLGVRVIPKEAVLGVPVIPKEAVLGIRVTPQQVPEEQVIREENRLEPPEPTKVGLPDSDPDPEKGKVSHGLSYNDYPDRKDQGRRLARKAFLSTQFEGLTQMA